GRAHRERGREGRAGHGAEAFQVSTKRRSGSERMTWRGALQGRGQEERSHTQVQARTHALGPTGRGPLVSVRVPPAAAGSSRTGRPALPRPTALLERPRRHFAPTG